MCFVTSKVLLESKGKDFGLDFPCNSSSFTFNSNSIFSFSISMRSCLSLSRSSISNLIFSCPIFSLINLSSRSNVSSLILSCLSSLSCLNLSSPSAFSILFFPLALLSHASISLHVLILFFLSQLAFQFLISSTANKSGKPLSEIWVRNQIFPNLQRSEREYS